MENSANALLMAGGILIAVIVLSLLVYMFSNIALIGGAEADREVVERLAKENAEWEAYNKKLVYGSEVLTVINKAEQNDIDYKDNSDYWITVVVLNKDGNAVSKAELKTDSKSIIFECTAMKYGNKTGKVNYIEFKERE